MSLIADEVPGRPVPVRPAGAEVEVTATAGGGAAIVVGPVPGIHRHTLAAQIGTIPGRGPRGTLDQGLQSLLGGGVAPGVEAIEVQDRDNALDGLLGDGVAGAAELPQRRGRDEADQQAEDRDDDEDLEQREAGVVRLVGPGAG